MERQGNSFMKHQREKYYSPTKILNHSLNFHLILTRNRTK